MAQALVYQVRLDWLAESNEATGRESEESLRYDVEYIRKQSFWFGVKLVVRQIWKILEEFVAIEQQRNP